MRRANTYRILVYVIIKKKKKQKANGFKIE